MGIKVLGAILLGVFTAGSAVSGVSSALGNNQTVANVSENFDGKTNDKKKDSNDKKEDSDKNLVFCGSNDSNSSNLKRNLALGGTGVACLAGGVALGIEAIGKGKEGEKAVAASEITPSESNGGKEEYEQYHNDSVNETTTSEETTDEELENENTSNSSSISDIFTGIFMLLFFVSCFVFINTGCCFCCCCCCES